MSAEIVSVANGIMTLKISGKLTHPELAAVQKRAEEILHQHGRMNILVIVDAFQGWEKEGDWGDLSFLLKNDRFMERMAIVGDKKWEDLALVFAGKGFRRCLVEYFPSQEAAKAQAWLTEKK